MRKRGAAIGCALYALCRMRVIGRFLVGTLAIVFAMGFIARLVRRRSLHQRRHARAVRLLGVKGPPALLLKPERAHAYLAAQPGGSGWGHLVVPPSSPSRVLRRRGRRGANLAPAAWPRRRQKRLRRGAMQKTVVRMNYAMWRSKARPQHGPDESSGFNGAVPRRRRRTG
jgi:hypothetical protein